MHVHTLAGAAGVAGAWFIRTLQCEHCGGNASIAAHCKKRKQIDTTNSKVTQSATLDTSLFIVIIYVHNAT